ncbi:MAG TPA: hypothetical protein VKB80_23530 [Kofleriaceae bacterium]|nr:hypothetical protein [Kofleriaceae bacterium]
MGLFSLRVCVVDVPSVGVYFDADIALTADVDLIVDEVVDGAGAVDLSATVVVDSTWCPRFASRCTAYVHGAGAVKVHDNVERIRPMRPLGRSRSPVDFL